MSGKKKMMNKDPEMKKCPVSEICGACTMQGISYAKQLEIKQEKVDRLFGKLGKVEKITGADDPLHYRNKSQISFGYDEKRNVIAGNYVESTHILVPIDECQLVDSETNRIFRTVISLVRKYRISIFDENRMTGTLRHVLVRNNHNSSEIMVVLVTGGIRFNNKERFINDLVKKHPNVTAVVQNINSRHTSMILGSRNINLYGKGYITDELCGCSFKISAGSFYQINHAQTEKLYRKAIKLAGIGKKDSVLDTYCGIGTIGIIAGGSAGSVTGVELNRQAVKDAVSNAKYNKVSNISFVAEDAGRYMDGCREKYDVVIMDPPRNGSDYRFLASLAKMKPGRIVYISCNPDTQYRDVKYLLKRGYAIKHIQPFDMFPYTDHIENIVLMAKTEK